MESIFGSLQRCVDIFSVIKDKDDVYFYLNMFSVRQALLTLTRIVSLLAFSTFCFLPLTNVSILMLNFTEGKAVKGTC